MIYGVYAIKDELAGEIMQPWMLPESDNMEATVKRFAAEIGKSSDLIKNNTGDYALYYLANFDSKTGKYNKGNPTKLASITEILNERRDSNGM